MKWMLLLCMVWNAGFGQSSLGEIRGLYEVADDSSEAAKELLELTREGNDEDPLALGYKGAAHMMMAKHVLNPFSKMSHFKKGKKMFSKAISISPENLELRFLRFAVQAEAPGFLGYREDIPEDKNVLIIGVHEIKNRKVRDMISSYLLGSELLNQTEKQKIRMNLR